MGLLTRKLVLNYPGRIDLAPLLFGPGCQLKGVAGRIGNLDLLEASDCLSSDCLGTLTLSRITLDTDY